MPYNNPIDQSKLDMTDPSVDLGKIEIQKAVSRARAQQMLVENLTKYDAKPSATFTRQPALQEAQANEAKKTFIQKLGLGMMAFSEGAGGAPLYSNYMDSQAKQKLEETKNKLGAPAEMFKMQREERLANSQQNAVALRLRSEFNQSPIKKEFDTLNRSFKQMSKAYDISTNDNTKSRIASDQALGVMIQKMLDPTSVVRESEYARTPEGAAVMSQLQSFIPKLEKGGMAISNDDRKAILEMAKVMVDAGGDLYNQHIDRYASSALEYGVEPQKILSGVNKYEPYSIGKEKSTSSDTTTLTGLGFDPSKYEIVR
jgi:hypothetical protein